MNMPTIKERKELYAMTYFNTDWEWLRDQLKKTGSAGTPVGNLVEEFVGVVEEAGIKRNQEKAVVKALDYTLKLLKGHPIYIESDSDSWINLVGGDLNVRDTVRVKPDAYSGASGVANNGKRGRVLAMRNGKITVLYDGDPVEFARGHEIDALQKLAVE